MLSGATTRTLQINVPAGAPELSCTVTLTLNVPAVFGVPLRVTDVPVADDNVNGPVAVHVNGPVPPLTESGRLNAVPVTTGCAGHVPVIVTGTITVIEHVNVAGASRPSGSVNVTVKL